MTHSLIPVRIFFILGRQIASSRESRRRVLNFLERTLLTCNILPFIIESHVFCLDIFIYMFSLSSVSKKQWFILFFIFTPEKQGKLIFRKDEWVFGSTCPAGQVCLKENFEPCLIVLERMRKLDKSLRRRRRQWQHRKSSMSRFCFAGETIKIVNFMFLLTPILKKRDK